jgi:hypothetical protein
MIIQPQLGILTVFFAVQKTTVWNVQFKFREPVVFDWKLKREILSEHMNFMDIQFWTSGWNFRSLRNTSTLVEFEYIYGLIVTLLSQGRFSTIYSSYFTLTFPLCMVLIFNNYYTRRLYKRFVRTENYDTIGVFLIWLVRAAGATGDFRVPLEANRMRVVLRCERG